MAGGANNNSSAAAEQNELGRGLAGSGKFDQAAACFARAIELAPDDPIGHNNLGITFRERRRFDEAIAAYQRAVALRPDYAEAWYNMGNALRDHRRLDEAAAAFRRAIEVRPGLVEAHNNLANVLMESKKIAEAIAVYRRIIELWPGFATAHNNLGGALREQGNFKEALAALDRAIAIKPDYSRAHSNRGAVLHQLNRTDDALTSLLTAIRLAPDSAEAFYQLSGVMKDRGQPAEALVACKKAIALKPDYAEAHCALANLFQEQADVDEAVAECHRALALKPDLAEAHNILGNALRDQGLPDEALASYRRAAELQPDRATIQSNIAFAVNFHPDFNARQILEENLRWAERFERPLLAEGHPPHDNDRSPSRRLKIGYVSPDFRRHPAACFILPLLAHHDRERVETICFSGVKRSDAVTEQCMRQAHAWHDVAGLSDEELATLIRREKIDILVDLTMHMASGRLLTFARKPAPIQVTWLAYPGTTGLSSIDYRLTDPHLDPPGETDAYYSEKSIRLAHSFWCYQAPIETPEVNALPMLQAGRMTFACFNHFAKVTAPTLKLWCETLSAIADSRMIILCSPGNHRERVWKQFESAGIARERIEFVPRLAPEEYFAMFHRVDVCLDPIPYPGHTSTLDGLWMGVPAITLRGQTAPARGGASILSNAGLHSFIAETPEQYLEIARNLAADPAALADVRAKLRQAMRASPLMDARAFASNLEDVYRRMWETWCMQG